MIVITIKSYLFYGGDGDHEEERQAAGDRAGGGVDDELQRQDGEWGERGEGEEAGQQQEKERKEEEVEQEEEKGRRCQITRRIVRKVQRERGKRLSWQQEKQKCILGNKNKLHRLHEIFQEHLMFLEDFCALPLYPFPWFL